MGFVCKLIGLSVIGHGVGLIGFQKFWKYQPLDAVKDYCGVKIGIYFSWIGYYTYMLVLASIFGFVSLLFSVKWINNAPVSQQICRNNTIVMCPQCAGKFIFSNLTFKADKFLQKPATIITWRKRAPARESRRSSTTQWRSCSLSSCRYGRLYFWSFGSDIHPRFPTAGAWRALIFKRNIRGQNISPGWRKIRKSGETKLKGIEGVGASNCLKSSSMSRWFWRSRLSHSQRLSAFWFIRRALRRRCTWTMLIWQRI